MRRSSKNSFTFYLIVLVLFIYLFFKFGLRFFVDMAFDITQKGSARNDIVNGQNNSKISLISEPILLDIPNATNEAILYITGKADPDIEISLFNNNEKEMTINSDFEGSFNFEYVLEERTNQFYVKSQDQYSRKSKESKIYDVTFIDTPPSLEVKNPEDGKKYYDANITIEGTTDKEVFVKVNNIPVVTKADGSFSYPFTLTKGNNDIYIIAEDVAGNITEKKISTTFVE